MRTPVRLSIHHFRSLPVYVTVVSVRMVCSCRFVLYACRTSSGLLSETSSCGIAGTTSHHHSSSNESAPTVEMVRGCRNGDREERAWTTIDNSPPKHHWYQGNLKWTYEEEYERSLLFLNTLVLRKEDGTVKFLVYRKKAHTDQYLNISSHHPLYKKLGIIKTLLDKCNNIVTEPEDRGAHHQASTWVWFNRSGL